MRVGVTVELSEREERFCWFLALGLRPTRAATASGWSVGSARLLLRKPQIRAALEAISKNSTAVLAKLERAEACREQSA